MTLLSINSLKPTSRALPCLLILFSHCNGLPCVIVREYLSSFATKFLPLNYNVEGSEGSLALISVICKMAIKLTNSSLYVKYLQA